MSRKYWKLLGIVELLVVVVEETRRSRKFATELTN